MGKIIVACRESRERAPLLADAMSALGGKEAEAYPGGYVGMSLNDLDDLEREMGAATEVIFIRDPGDADHDAFMRAKALVTQLGLPVDILNNADWAIQLRQLGVDLGEIDFRFGA